MSPARTLEVFRVFLRLGLTSFGGPVAHLGYFRREFVARRGWLSEQDFAELVALAQSLPGPASSQVGFAIGLLRARYAGALAAWCGFTLPSAALLIAFGFGAASFNGAIARGVLHGLQLLAVAVVAQAVLAMARRLTPDLERAAIALGAAILVLASHWPMVQLAAIVSGAALGWLICRAEPAEPAALLVSAVTARAGWIAWALFLLLFAGVFAIPDRAAAPALALFGACYRSGSLVFGGGHVVLPLLHGAFVTPGWVSDQAFMSGYGAAQAVPGPLFTFAAYLGSIAAEGPRGIAGALIGLAGIFLPGLLLLVGALPHWQRLRRHTAVRRCLAGVNAAVVGLLAAALYRPIWTGSVGTLRDVLLVVLCFALLVSARVPVLAVALIAAVGGVFIN
ncbi:MAG: chromate efflux transporter [Steroidobacteraceae bacterium]